MKSTESGANAVSLPTATGNSMTADGLAESGEKVLLEGCIMTH